MQELRVAVPTYRCPNATDDKTGLGSTDFAPPFVPVVVHEAAGLRIVLGTHDWQDVEYPDVQIERRLNGWAIFLHPVGGSDPSGYVYFLDDGRSFAASEETFGPTPALEVVKCSYPMHELDRPRSTAGLPPDLA